MVLLAAVIFPHGAMPFDGDRSSSSQSVRDRQTRLNPAFMEKLSQLYEGSSSAARSVAELEADLYILHTAHGICLSESYGVYANVAAEGDAEWLDQWSEFKAKAALDQPRSKQLKDTLRSAGVDVQAILCYGRSAAAKMRWSESIPIWYLQQFIKNDPKYIIVAEDTKPPAGVLEQCRVDIGSALAKFIESIAEKVVLVISGDLSHCYETASADPLYQPDPYLWDFPTDNEAAVAFEEAIRDWTRAETEGYWDPSIAESYLKKAAELDPRALSCGIKGFIVLHGLLKEYTERGHKFRPKLHACCAPTYYGMLSATFIKQ